MTETELEAAEKKRRWKKTAFALGLGGVCGFLGAMGVLNLLETDAFADVTASVEIACLVGMLYAVTGAVIGIGLLNPKAGATYLNVEDAEEIEEQRGMLTNSALAMFIAGVALIVVALAGAAGPIDPAMALGFYVIASIIAVWLSIRSGRYQDELMREMGRQTAAMAFYLVVLIGGSWVLLAHLQYVTAPAPLDWLTMFWALMLLGAFIVVGKRGMFMMR